jgi:hypothetical protein
VLRETTSRGLCARAQRGTARTCAAEKRCEHRRNDVNTVVMFFSVRTKKLPFRLLQVRWLDTAGFAGFGIHAPTMVEPKRGGSAF